MQASQCNGPALGLRWSRMKIKSLEDEQKNYVSLKLAQVVVEGLDIGENTHGVWFTTHDHHVIHLNQPVTACLCPGRKAGDKNRLLQMQHDMYV